MMRTLFTGMIVLSVIAGSSFTAGASTLAPGNYTVAGRMVFDYTAKNTTKYLGIDVVNIWNLEVINLTPDKTTYKFQTVFTVSDALPMVEAPMEGFRAAFNFSLTQVGNGSFSGQDGALTFYLPNSNTVWDPDNNASNGTSEKFNTSWNGLFGSAGIYEMKQTGSSSFKSWTVRDIMTFVEPGSYSLETKNGYAWNGDDGDSANNLNFVIPGPSTVVPEPASMLLIGSGLAGLVGLRRRK